MLISSQRTIVIDCPFKSCFATIEARRPSKCPFPSIVICFSNVMLDGLRFGKEVEFDRLKMF